MITISVTLKRTHFPPVMLATNFFHHKYHGKCFRDNAHRMKKLNGFLMDQLSADGLSGYAAYKKFEAPFDKLLGKKIVKPALFLDLAETNFPELSQFAQKLLHVPVTTFRISFAELPKVV